MYSPVKLAATIAATAVCLSGTPAAAQQGSPCGLLTSATASTVLGESVQTAAQPLVPGVDVCNVLDARGIAFSVTRVTDVIAPGDPLSPGALAQSYFPDLSDAAAAQIDALAQPGMNLSLPGFQIGTVGGLGGSAILVKQDLGDPPLEDTLLVRRGSDI